MSDLRLDDAEARSAQAELHHWSARVGLDLSAADCGSPRVQTALESWLSWQAQAGRSLSAALWTAGDEIRRSGELIEDADRRIAAATRSTTGVEVAR